MNKDGVMKKTMKGKSPTRKEFQVALLMDDVVEAKTISDGLREIGIFAHYYQGLDELWVALNTHTPDLCIVDVKKMSSGQLLFAQHPKVKKNELKYAFYYKDSTKVLLNATFGMNHYGLIRAEVNLVDQLKSVLLRRNEELHLLEQVNDANARIQRLKLRSVRLNEAQEKNHQILKQDETCQELIHNLGSTNSFGEFHQRLIYLFSNWKDCAELGIYKLNSTHQKLVSIKSKEKKFKNLPDLWLSTACPEGISQYAVDMANDVCYGIMDEGLMTLNICGAYDRPDMLLIGRFDKTNTEFFNWKNLENKLSSEYRKLIVKEQRGQEVVNHVESVFTTFQNLDDIQYHQVEATHRFAVVDFSNLVSMIKQRTGNRFYWKAFSNEFLAEICEVLSGNFKISYYGVGAFLVGMEKKYIESDYNKLKAYVEDFQFWRYFEDSSVVISNDITPEVRFVAPSSVNVIRQMEDGHSDFMGSSDQHPTQHAKRLEV